MKLSTRLRIRGVLVWLARTVVGFTFIISGWSKSIDPWGFVIKVGEYLDAWGMTFPHEAIVAGCVTLACIEFLTGVLLIAGSLKRTSAIVAAAMMAVMLPLTLYIAIADPVADCGCFGDFWVISNWGTFSKNVVLTALIVYLLMRNSTVRGLYPAAIQWLVVAVSIAFPLFLALFGYQIQPLLDFRPYKTGTTIFAGASSAEGEKFIYEKDGERREFGLDALPDSTWTFVEAQEADAEGRFDGSIAVLDDDGYDVSADIVEPDGRQLFLIVPQPSLHYLVYAHYVEQLVDYAKREGIGFVAVVGAGGRGFSRWSDWVRPDFEVYTADVTVLKQLVRGPEALVYTDGGIIKWKRTLRSLPNDLPKSTNANALDAIQDPDNGRIHGYALLMYLASMLVIYLLGQSPRALRFFISLAGRRH